MLSVLLLQGVLNGREIFMQDNFVATDDAAAGGADEYQRDDDDEARINEMFEQVRQHNTSSTILLHGLNLFYKGKGAPAQQCSRHVH